MSTVIDFHSVEPLIRMAIAEDIGEGDVTSDAIFTEHHESRALILSKDTGVFCGGDMIQHVYACIDPTISIGVRVPDGTAIEPGEMVAELRGSTRSLLMGERIVLNFIQRMSGIATRTRQFVLLTAGSGMRILDTRKTLPGFRLLDKYAVLCGGGTNHRMGLYDMVMIKDNHIEAAGSVNRAIELVRKRHGSRYKIEVEAASVQEAADAAHAGVDIIMLDNMDAVTMKHAVEIINGRTSIEVSGTMNEEKIAALKDYAIDFVSIGALTHSVKAFDLSMKFAPE